MQTHEKYNSSIFVPIQFKFVCFTPITECLLYIFALIGFIWCKGFFIPLLLSPLPVDLHLRGWKLVYYIWNSAYPYNISEVLGLPAWLIFLQRHADCFCFPLIFCRGALKKLEFCSSRLTRYYIHRIYSVDSLWGNVKKCSGDLPFYYRNANEV